jgi:hypothetical protein
MIPAMSKAADFFAFPTMPGSTWTAKIGLPALALLLKIYQVPGFHPCLPRFPSDNPIGAVSFRTAVSQC